MHAPAANRVGERFSARTLPNAVIAGVGPGGLEMARIAAETGHDVVLFEKANQIRGQLRIAGAGLTREELLDFVFYLERELKRLEVPIHLQTEATKESILALTPDLVVVATGATPMPPEFKFDADARCNNLGSSRKNSH